MGHLDAKSNTRLDVLFAKAAVTASQTIQGVNVSDFRGAMFVIDQGAHTADDLTVTFQHRDGSDSWVNIPDSDLDGVANGVAIVAGGANGQINVGYKGNKSQIGAIITDGGSGNAVLGVYVIKAYPKSIPAT